MSRDIAHAQWRSSIVPMGTWYLGHNISESVRDRDLGPTDHQYEMAHWDSNGNVTDDVTWPRKVKVVTPICLMSNISEKRYRLGSNGPPIVNGPLGFGHVTDDVRSCDVHAETMRVMIHFRKYPIVMSAIAELVLRPRCFLKFRLDYFRGYLKSCSIEIPPCLT